RRFGRAWRSDDRAQSFVHVESWRIEGPDDGSSGIHSLFLRQAGEGVSKDHLFHPDRLRQLACHYVPLVQSLFPFDLLIAYGSGRARDGGAYGLHNRVLAIVDGKVGFLRLRRARFDPLSGAMAGAWTNLEWSSTGPTAPGQGPTI